MTSKAKSSLVSSLPQVMKMGKSTCVTNLTPAVAQCTTTDCFDNDVGVLAAMVYRLQATVERQQNDCHYSLKQLQLSVEEQQKQLIKLKELLNRRLPVRDCYDVLKDGYNVSGMYEIYLDKARKFIKVFCDMETDGGGWLVFQRRQDGSVDFYRDWASYKEGFGDMSGEFWLGNAFLHEITSQARYSLRIDLEDFEDASRYAVYSNFAVASEANKYRLSLGAYSGTAENSFSREDKSAFSTKDQDNDQYSGHCARLYKGAWWYKSCHEANLNGLYLGGSHTSYADGIEWRHWHGYHYSLKKTEMKKCGTLTFNDININLCGQKHGTLTFNDININLCCQKCGTLTFNYINSNLCCQKYGTLTFNDININLCCQKRGTLTFNYININLCCQKCGTLTFNDININLCCQKCGILTFNDININLCCQKHGTLTFNDININLCCQKCGTLTFNDININLCCQKYGTLTFNDININLCCQKYGTLTFNDININLCCQKCGTLTFNDININLCCQKYGTLTFNDININLCCQKHGTLTFNDININLCCQKCGTLTFNDININLCCQKHGTLTFNDININLCCQKCGTLTFNDININLCCQKHARFAKKHVRAIRSCTYVNTDESFTWNRRFQPAAVPSMERVIVDHVMALVRAFAVLFIISSETIISLAAAAAMLDRFPHPTVESTSDVGLLVVGVTLRQEPFCSVWTVMLALRNNEQRQTVCHRSLVHFDLEQVVDDFVELAEASVVDQGRRSDRRAVVDVTVADQTRHSLLSDGFFCVGVALASCREHRAAESKKARIRIVLDDLVYAVDDMSVVQVPLAACRTGSCLLEISHERALRLRQEVVFFGVPTHERTDVGAGDVVFLEQGFHLGETIS
ncbi:Ryncolin-1 [Lamellibrachia satsuma]|nr:Ryncolin-1 [Lamellibrachia satsuma]